MVEERQLLDEIGKGGCVGGWRRQSVDEMGRVGVCWVYKHVHLAMKPHVVNSRTFARVGRFRSPC